MKKTIILLACCSVFTVSNATVANSAERNNSEDVSKFTFNDYMNMTDEEITSIIKQQLDTNASWKVTSYVLEGNDDYDYTYSYKSAKSYVMVPDRESVNESIKKINEILITEQFTNC